MNASVAVAMDGGYVRLHRSILEWEWYGDEAVTVLFLHLLLTANWRPGKFRGEDVEPGSLITSLDKLADTFGWSRGKLRRTLDKLKSTGEVVTETTNHWTTVTLVNWAKYQSGDQPTDQQTANSAPTVRQQPATIEEGKKERRKEEIHTRKSLFANCPFADVETAKAQLPELVEAGIDLAAYRDAIRNWSDTKNELRTERGWLATYRQWVKRDEERGTVKRIVAVTEKQRPVWNML